MAFYPAFIPTHALFEEKAGKSQSVKLRRHLSCRLRVLNSSFALHVWKVTQLCVCCEFEFWTERRVCHHRHIAFLAVIEDAPLLTKTVKINQSEGIPGSGIPERTFVKNSYKNSRTSLPNPPLLFIAFFTSHRSPLSERLEQARVQTEYGTSIIKTPSANNAISL